MPACQTTRPPTEPTSRHTHPLTDPSARLSADLPICPSVHSPAYQHTSILKKNGSVRGCLSQNQGVSVREFNPGFGQVAGVRSSRSLARPSIYPLTKPITYPSAHHPPRLSVRSTDHQPYVRSNASLSFILLPV